MERGKRNVHKMINRSYPSLSQLHITGKLVCTALSAGHLSMLQNPPETPLDHICKTTKNKLSPSLSITSTTETCTLPCLPTPSTTSSGETSAYFLRLQTGKSPLRRRRKRSEQLPSRCGTRSYSRARSRNQTENYRLLPSRLQHYRPSGYSIGAQGSSTRMWPAIAHNAVTRPNIPDTDYDLRVFFRRSSTLNQSMIYGINQDEFMKMFPNNTVQTVRYPVPNRFPRKKASRDGPTIDEVSVNNVTLGQYTILRYEHMNLTNCPSVKYAENCQLLSLQYNHIVKINNLQRMENLIFLDLSNNQLNSICGLNDLISLRVLLLPKNHIRRIQGLDQLLKLEVLDLHQNHIRQIENLAHLTRLRLLNLASNKIVFVNGLSGMQSLTELNLRHNQIVQIEPMLNLPSLAWIFLSTNQIERWTQISGLAGLSARAQVTLDGNPIVLDPMYRRIVPTTPALQSEHTGTRNEQVTPASGGSLFRGKQDPRRGDYEMIMVNTPSFEKMSNPSTKLSPALSGIQSPNGDFYKHDSDRDTSLSEILLQSHLTDMEPHSLPGCTKVGELFSIRMEPEGEMTFKEDSTVSTPPPTHSDDRPVKSSDTSVPLFKNVQIMTKNSFLISKSLPHRTQRVKWYIKDRTHLYLTGEPIVADTQSVESTIDLLQNLKTALTDLTNARPFERSIPGGPVPVRGSHLNHITSVTVIGLDWSEFTVELARIRILLPEMKDSASP
ncbi:hypothetical protein EG68_09107 [Paragonimus skrjabini miyazakii]|uniref:Leucine-rich repeat-containing protein 49 n=1 Tax=Paragonimus skrjabini miyazakii TaxID=59628 RepID=A0A8S9YLX8_9TREM|nr:hypothetical protein EG68_09107 [Paragonimus skrjabini miyazakii]